MGRGQKVRMAKDGAERNNALMKRFAPEPNPFIDLKDSFARPVSEPDQPGGGQQD
jgi:hypothetical protein